MEDVIQAKLSLAQLSFDQHRLDRATKLLEEILSEDPSHPKALYLLGVIQIISKNPLAKTTVRSLLSSSPDLASSHYLLGIYSHYAEKNHVGAETSYRDSIRLDPENTLPRSALARLLGEKGRLEEAITTAHQTLKIDPNNLSSYELLAELYRLNKEDKLAEKFARRGLELDPENASVHLEIGLRLLHQGDGLSARGNLRESLRLEPDNSGLREEIAHEKIKSHPFFKNGFFLSFKPPTLVCVLLTPVFWWLLSQFFRPLIYIAWLSIGLAILAYLYHGLFLLSRRLTLRRINQGRID